MKLTALTSLLCFFILPAFSQVKSIRTGQHSLTIQWISFTNAKPGTATIKQLDKNKYSIEGEQRNDANADYVTIKGTFKAVDKKLYFEGKIVKQIADINQGQPCELNGPAIFRASGKRKYWRLQQMTNCDGETTDYVDIFF